VGRCKEFRDAFLNELSEDWYMWLMHR
jgi:hypothetical protein